MLSEYHKRLWSTRWRWIGSRDCTNRLSLSVGHLRHAPLRLSIRRGVLGLRRTHGAPASPRCLRPRRHRVDPGNVGGGVQRFGTVRSLSERDECAKRSSVSRVCVALLRRTVDRRVARARLTGVLAAQLALRWSVPGLPGLSPTNGSPRQQMDDRERARETPERKRKRKVENRLGTCRRPLL